MLVHTITPTASDPLHGAPATEKTGVDPDDFASSAARFPTARERRGRRQHGDHGRPVRRLVGHHSLHQPDRHRAERHGMPVSSSMRPRRRIPPHRTSSTARGCTPLTHGLHHEQLDRAYRSGERSRRAGDRRRQLRPCRRSRGGLAGDRLARVPHVGVARPRLVDLLDDLHALRRPGRPQHDERRRRSCGLRPVRRPDLVERELRRSGARSPPRTTSS